MKKRIGILYPFTGKTFGGSHVSVINMIKKLDNKLFHPIVFLHKKGRVLEVLKKEKIEFIYDKNIDLVKSNNFIQFFIFSLKNYFKIKKVFKANEIDIVHSNDGLIHATWNIPTILNFKKFIWHIRSRDDSRRLSIYAFFASKILSISKFCKEGITRAFSHKVKVVKNFFSEIKDNKINGSNKFKTISFVANYKSQKRPELFFEIINKLNYKKNNLKFNVFGSFLINEKKNLLNLVSSKKTRKKIIFKGHKFPIDSHINNSDIILCLGEREGFGRVVIESMLNKVLIIATNEGGHKEIIQNKKNGILVDSKNINKFVSEIKHYLDKKIERNKIINNAFKFAKKNYIIENKVKVIEDIYQKLI